MESGLPPQILRIKRKRGQDPLQALILEDRQSAKRSKPSSPTSSKPRTPVSEARNWYFQLCDTDDKVTQPDPNVLASVLSEAISSKDKRQFVIPKSQTEEDIVIPNELSQMLDQFLDVNEVETPKRKRRGGNIVAASDNAEGSENQSTAEDYVFDVYKLSSTVPLTNDNYPQSQIGYIRFFDDDEYDLLHSEDEAKSQTRLYSDDEDSNAESFYQNDYPEDEDAGEYSETYEVFGDDAEDEEDENVGPVIVDSIEDAEGHAYLQGHVQADQAESAQFDNLYDDFFDETGKQRMNLLENESDSEDMYRTQNFHSYEEDDALENYRDRILGRLQNMIDES